VIQAVECLLCKCESLRRTRRRKRKEEGGEGEEGKTLEAHVCTEKGHDRGHSKMSSASQGENLGETDTDDTLILDF
jgi:hypothetical protein